MNITVAIDGYSSTGKSTLAKLIARKYSLLYLDSGAIYRAVTLKASDSGVFSEGEAIDESLLRKLLKTTDIDFKAEGTYLDGRLVEREIRSLAVSQRVSPVSALPFVREYVDTLLRGFGSKGGLVMDGRDIGTTVFPKAEIKLFLTASEQVRCQRRLLDLRSKGEEPSEKEVLANLRERDYIDSHRETSPLAKAADAFVLDNSELSLEQELLWFDGLLRGRLGLFEA